MPFGYNGFASSDTAKVGTKYTRFQGPLLVGERAVPAGQGAVSAPHLVNVSTLGADFINAATTFASTAGVTVSTASPAGLLYMSMTSADIIAAGSTANAPVSLPGGATAAAVVWDSAKKTLGIYDPLSSAWLWPHVAPTTTSSFGAAGQLAGAVITWSATSS